MNVVKNRTRFLSVIIFFFSIIILGAISFSGCEVGLGPAVDTQPPSITIEKPEVDKVIRNKFLISGTWSDDGMIDSIVVILKRTDGKTLDGINLERQISATFEEDLIKKETGTWQAIVDPIESEQKIIDGTYQATVYIKDKGNHTTTQNTTFTIDNTPPVLILTKPNSTPDDDAFSSYGQRLFLEGSIADSTKDTWVQLDFYSGEECTEDQFLETIETEMISPTDVNSNNARLAIYNSDLSKEFAQEYFKLYGHNNEKAGAEQIYAKLTVYDTAETFPIDGESDNLTPSGKIKGNASQSFYLTKKLAESITKSQTANGYGLAPIDIYNVLNGTYALKNASRAAESEIIMEELCSDEQKKNITVFTINPENSPYFTISGLKTLNLDGKDFEEGNTIVNGTQTIEVSVFMGSDSIALKDDENFYVYLLECDNYGNPKKEDVEENRIKLYSKYKETGKGSEKKSYYKIGGKTDHKTASGAYVFSIPMNKSLRADPDAGLDGFVNINLEYGTNYIIRVSGKDTEDNEIETTDNGYGFCFTAGGTAPRITITEPAENTVFIKKGDGLTVKGTVTSEAGEPRFTISNDENMVELPLTQAGEATYSFEKEIAPDELGFDQNESVIYSLIFSATRDATETTQTKSVWYDVDGPAITIGEPTPLIKKDSVKADGTTVEKDSINGTVTFNGSIIDEFDSRFGSATYKVKQNNNIVPGLSGSLEKNYTFSIDTTKLTDKQDAVIVISAYDYIGNLSEIECTYYVDQSTDKPVIKAISDSVDISQGRSEEVLEAGKNLFVRGGSLVLNVQDDDSVKSAVVLIGKKKENGTFEVPTSADTTGTLYKTYDSPSAISHQLPTTVGVYLATVLVYDKNYLSDTQTPHSFSKCEFILRITGTGPDVTLSPEKDFISTRNGIGSNKITFTIADEGNGPYKVFKDDQPLFEGSTKESPIEYTITYPANTEEADEIAFKIMDKNQGFTDKIYKPKFDNILPEVSITACPNKDLTEETSYLFKGGMSDSPSGIDSVKIKFIDGDNSESQTAIASEWQDCIAGSKSWNYEAVWESDDLKNVFATEGKKSVIVKAIDNAGNEKTVSDTFVYDKMKPVIEDITGSEITNGSDVTLTVNIKDTNPVKPAVVIRQNGTEIQPTENVTVGDVTGSGSAYTSEIVIPFSSVITTDGVYEIEVIAKDLNGKTSSPKYVKITRDSAKPVVTNVKLAEEELSRDAYSNNGKYYVNNTKSTYKISGIATDNIGVESVTLVVTSKDNATVTTSGTFNGSVGQWSFTGINLKSWSGTGATASIVVKDQAGNIAQENVSLDIVFDVIAPAPEHQIDDSNKDLVFRIGDYAYDAGDSDVGGKYSNGTYGSALTMQIRGYYPDNEEGSGINKIYYKVFEYEVSIDENKANATVINEKIYFKTLNDLRDYVIANKTDTFSPLAATETRNVEYNITPAANVADTVDRLGGGTLTNGYNLTSKGYVQFRKSITTNYKTTIKGFKEGKNYLVIVAEDNVGNSSVDHAEVPTPENPTVTAIYPCYSLNVDITAPSISSDSDEGIYTNLIKKLASGEPNPDSKVEISGTVSDKSNDIHGSSGLKNIVFTSNQSSEKITLNLTSTGGTPEDPTLINWTVDIRPLLTKAGNAIISAKVTDNAGYATSTPIANVTVDKTTPTVRITSPEANSYIGSKINLSGTATDGQGAGLDTSKKMILCYTTSGTAGASAPIVTPSDTANPSNGWTKLAEINAAESWSHTVNVSSLSGITDNANTTVYFSISATDKAGTGNTGYSAPRSVVIDKKKPVVEITVPATESGAVIQAGSYKFEGTISDENEISEGKAELYAVTGEGNSLTETKISETALSITPPETTGENWTWSCQVYDLTAATYRIKVTAKDAAGNDSTVITSPRIYIDNTPPVVHVEQTGLRDSNGNSITEELVTGTTYYTKGDYTFTVTVDDINFDNNDTSLYTVTASANQTLTITKDSQNKNKFTFEPATPVDGLFTYTIKDVKDKAGNKANDVIIKVQRDTTGPIVEIRNPANDITDPANSLSGTSYSFRINANDRGGVGVAKLYYVFSKNSSAPASGWIEESLSDGDFNIDQNLETLGEGNWYLYAKAEDKSGNLSSSVEKRAFPIDKSAPTLTVNDLVSGVNPVCSEVDDGYTISGTASDTNEMHETEAITIDVDGIKTKIAKSSITTGDAWSYKILTGTENGKLKSNEPVVVKVTAKDIAGKTTEKNYTLYYDTKDPELSVTSPVDDEKVTLAEKEIKGTVSDGGYGIKKLEYKLYNSANEVINSGTTEGENPDVIIKGEQWYIKGSGKISLGSEGALRLDVIATENKPEGATAVEGRQYVTTKTVNFYYDVANPELTETGIGTRGKTTKAGFILSGVASDSNALASVTIKWKVGTTDKSIALTPSSTQLNSMSWSKDFVVGSTNDSKTNYVSDGANEFTIIAKDITGKEKQLTRTVVVDTQKDVIGTVTVDATGGVTIGTGENAIIWYKTTSIPVTVPVTERGPSEVSKVEYATQSGDNVTWNPLSSSGTNYTGTVNFGGDGSQTMRLRTTDVAGNVSEEKTVSVNIDTSAPVLSALYYKKGSEAAKALDSTVYLKTGTPITVYGNYKDEQSGVENLTFKIGDTAVTPTVTYSTTEIGNSAPSDSLYNEENAVTITGNETTIKSWKAVITPAADGQFTVTGKNRVQTSVDNQKIFTIAIDGDAPTVTIINPGAGIDPISGTSYSFRINADDGTGVGVTQLSYAFATTSTVTAADVWTTIDFTGGDKNIDMPLETGTTPVKDANGKVTKLCEGDWYVFAKAVDKAGNETTTAVSRAFTVDRSNPTLTVDGLNESGVNALYKEISNDKYELSGTVSDSNALASTGAVSIEIDEQTPVFATVSGTSWTYNLDVGTTAGTLQKDTLVSVKVTAKDVTGKTTEKNYTLYYDTKDPELEVTAPVINEAVETDTKVIKGTVSDGGYGIKKLEYSLYSGSTLIASGNTDNPDTTYPIAIKGEQWYISKNEGKVPLGTTEGALRLVVTATENKPEGASTVTGRQYVTTKTVDFYYDKANPTLTETVIGATGKTKNEGFTLSGVATDSNALASVEISWGTNNKITLTPTSQQLKSMSWSQAFVVGSATGTNHVADGTNEFTIIAKDITGKEKQLTRTVVVDTVKPTCGTPTITSSKNTVDGKDWYKSSFIDIKLENVKDEGGTGISKVEYTTESGDSAHWYSMNSSASVATTYTATVNCANQGSNTITVRVTDAAGNIKNAGTLTAYVDTKEPSLENSYAKYLTGGYQAVSELLIHGDNGYELKISVKDEDAGTGANSGKNSGIASVEYSYSNSDGTYTIDGTKSEDEDAWIITVPKTGNGTNRYSPTGSNKIYVIIKDNAGNEIKERVLTVTKDTTAPTVEIKSFTKAGTQTNSLYDVNGTITISGLADDTNKFDSVKLEYQKDGTSTWTTIPTTSQTSWSTTLNTKTLTDNKKYTIKATATDAAGNTNEATQDIYVNQDSDRPVITVTNITLATKTEGNVTSYDADETSYLKRTSRLEGTVSDDDGNVTKLEYSTNGTSWTEASLEYGTAWSIADLPEGENKLYFRVTDSANTTPFTTVVESESATSEAANQPKIKDNSNTYVTHTQGSLALNFKVVTKQPDVEEKKYQVFNSKANNGTGAWENRDSLGTLGGDYTKFKITLKAKSDAFIGSVKAKYATDAYDITFTTTETTTNNSYHTWISPEIDLDSSKTEIKLKISDASSTTDPMTLEQTVNYAVDNTPPKINIKDPSQVVGVKETMQFDVSEGATVYFAVTKKEVTTAPTAANAWTQLLDNSNGLTWYAAFDDDLALVDHTKRFALYLVDLGITTEDEILDNDSPFTEITDVHFWVKAVDQCGNVGTAYKVVKVDPQGNRPSVKLAYPTNDENGEPPTKGGTIRLDGTVTDDIAAKYVWIQIDTGNDGFGLDDLKFLSTSKYPIGKISTNTEVADTVIQALLAGTSVTDYGIMVPVSGTSWNLSINTNQEFNQKADDLGKARLDIKFFATDADPDKSDNTNVIIHKSIDENNTQTILIDSKAPYIDSENLYLVKYDGNTEIARKVYKEGDNVHGIWYLQGTIKDDDSGIKEIKYKFTGDEDFTKRITSAGGTWTDSSNTHFYFKPKSRTYDGKIIYDYEFSIPLGSSASGQVGESTVKIVATENTELGLNTDSAPSYKVTYDNKAPEFITENNVNVKLDPTVQNSNGFYTFGAVASEDKINKVSQSGVERIAFYFTRDLNYSLNTIDNTLYASHTGEKDGKTNDLFDVMVKHVNKDSDDTGSGNMIINYKGKSEGAGATLTYSEGLYWKKISGKTKDKTFTYTSAVDPNIHARGLIKINGVIYLINSVNGKIVNLDDDFGSTEKSVDAYFAICNVIDKGGEKNGSAIAYPNGYGYGYYSSRNTDDGDLITETFNSQGTEWIFDASINSKNLPDGPITLHMVAFDKAGNYTETPVTMDGTVSNNAPRIAGLILGTDENGNGQVDDGEFNNISYHEQYEAGRDARGEEMHNVMFPVQDASKDNPKSALTIKGTTVIKPEIVGGNGKITYKYSVYEFDSKTDGEFIWKTTAEKANVTGSVIATGTTDDSIATLSAFIELSVTDFIGTIGTAQEPKDSSVIKDGKYKKFVFNFSDNTPGKNGAAQSDNATLNVIMDVALRETNKAKNWILPFYWNSSDDNSLFGQSKNNGHIELATDWVTVDAFDSSKAEYDADPKVSGMIKLEGIAQDDTLINQIFVKLGTAMISTNGLTTDDKVIATYVPSTATWTLGSSLTKVDNEDTIPAAGWASEIKQATYGELLAVKAITALPDGKKATDEVPYTSQDLGHVVHWILYLDTSKITGVAATNVTVTATANDRGTPEYNGSAVVYSPNDTATTGGQTISAAVTKTDSTINQGDLTGYYRMDVVPYITKISTGVRTASGLKDNNIRSASGKYSILANNAANVITVSGFNFSTTALVAKIANIATSAGIAITNTNGGTAVTIAATNTTTATITNSNITKSGYLELFSNTIRALNNINSNDSYGTAKNSSGVQLTGTNATVSDYTNAYNREPDYYTTKNVQLTDDRYLRFFNMKDTGKKNGYYPNMIMDGNDPVFGFVDLNGTTDSDYGNTSMARMKAGYQPQRAKFSGSTGAQSSIEYLIGGLAWDQMAMAKDAAGKYMHATVYNYSESNMAFIYNTFASNHTWKLKGSGTAYKGAWGLGGTYADMSTTNQYSGTTTWHITRAQTTKNNAIALESIEYGNGALVGRYQNIKMVVKGNSTTETGAKVYMAYYDDNTTNKDVIFRTFRVAKSSTNNSNQLYDNGVYSNLTEENTSGRIAVRPANNTTIRGSKYLDLGVTSDNHVVVVYYDTNEGKLKMFYSGNTIDGSSITPTPNWTAASVSFPSYVGTDVSMVIDDSDGIHITASDSTDSDLVYMYMPSYSSSTLKTIKVDQAFAVGTWTSIKVKGNATDGYVPYIAYYNATETGSRDTIKLAYFADTTKKISSAAADTIQGVDSNGYTTGIWEYMTVPAITPPQGGDSKFRAVCLDFDSSGNPVVGYLGTNLEFGKALGE